MMGLHRSPDAAATVRAALEAAPAGLVSDYDGTLAPIAEDPARAGPAHGAAAVLRDLAGRLAVVALVTGRAPLDARRLIGLDDLLVVGNHGVEWLEPGAPSPAAAPGLDPARDAIGAALARVDGVAPGLILEAKGLSATVHYRTAPDAEAARRAVLDALGAEPDPRLEIREGRMSVELRPAAAGDKGSALERIVDRFALRGLVVLGDDLTDLDMFRAAARLRGEGRLRACIVAVGARGEVPPAVTAAADVEVDDPIALVALLRESTG